MVMTNQQISINFNTNVILPLSLYNSKRPVSDTFIDMCWYLFGKETLYIPEKYCHIGSIKYDV
jgi:hypothetical protein